MQAWAHGYSTDGYVTHPKIGPVPWVYIRRELAKQWGIPPWEVDTAPLEEIEIEMAIRALESDALKG